MKDLYDINDITRFYFDSQGNKYHNIIYKKQNK